MIVYLIRCRVSDKAYVGQTINTFKHRWAEHLSAARHGSIFPLHAAIRKYGAENFESCILMEANTLDELNALEEYHIKVQNTVAPNGYNVKPGGSNHTCHAETKEKLRLANTGRKRSPETCALLSKVAKGRRFSAETRAKWSAQRKGRKLAKCKKRTPETKARKSRGVKRPDISARLKGNTHTLGHKLTPVHRAKIGAASRNRKPKECCRNGHPYTTENTAYSVKKRCRVCKKCIIAGRKRYTEARRRRAALRKISNAI